MIYIIMKKLPCLVHLPLISFEKITKAILNVYKVSSRFIVLRSLNSRETLVTLYLSPLRLLA